MLVSTSYEYSIQLHNYDWQISDKAMAV